MYSGECWLLCNNMQFQLELQLLFSDQDLPTKGVMSIINLPPPLPLQVSKHHEAPFSLLQVCAEFGLPLLQSYLTRHVISHLTLETVCQTLVGASSLMQNSRDRDESLRLALKQIAQESNSYIISHARAVFQGRGYLDLPKETFIGIISSNEVCTIVCVSFELSWCSHACRLQSVHFREVNMVLQSGKPKIYHVTIISSASKLLYIAAISHNTIAVAMGVCWAR